MKKKKKFDWKKFFKITGIVSIILLIATAVGSVVALIVAGVMLVISKIRGGSDGFGILTNPFKKLKVWFYGKGPTLNHVKNDSFRNRVRHGWYYATGKAQTIKDEYVYSSPSDMYDDFAENRIDNYINR